MAFLELFKNAIYFNSIEKTTMQFYFLDLHVIGLDLSRKIYSFTYFLSSKYDAWFVLIYSIKVFFSLLLNKML